MATIVVLPSQSRGPGTFSFASAAVPTGITGVTLQMDRATMTSPTLRIDWALKLSLDSGVSWLPWGGASTVGGEPLVGMSSFTIALPDEENAGRRVRGSLTLNEAVVLAMTLVTSP